MLLSIVAVPSHIPTNSEGGFPVSLTEEMYLPVCLTEDN